MENSKELKTNSKYKVLFVCLGNICRSPAAQGIFEHIVRENGMTDRLSADSAGLYGGHAGQHPDRRMRTESGKVPSRVIISTLPLST